MAGPRWGWRSPTPISHPPRLLTPILTVDGSITGPSNTITLTTDPRYRHKGIFAAGVRLNNTSNNGDAIVIKDNHVRIEWHRGGLGQRQPISISAQDSSDNKIVIRHNLMHDTENSSTAYACRDRPVSLYEPRPRRQLLLPVQRGGAQARLRERTGR